ncbi:MAG: M1 family metallopeptidase [Candidatus Micrarchaeota archaeon]|nr:M1 family metallopeptidase [Candidatus Micrarchaeota archaeon]
MAKATHRTLGDNFTPSNYSLILTPNMKTFRYGGKETISGSIRRRTRSIRLNSSELKLSRATISSSRGSQEATIRENRKESTITLTVPQPVGGEVQVRIEFEGVNNDGMYGFYRSRYTHNGREEYILTSQFEAPSARTAFPCVDEPGFKATFDLELIIDKELTAISNMPVREQVSTLEGKRAVRFQRTPKMSTYLLYMAVGKFESVSTKLGTLPIRVLTVPGKVAYASMALEYAKRFIKFFNEYFGIKFPLPKMDLIAIPDFAAGAMENWGAITFREIVILGDEKISSVAIKQRIAEVIAHELAHQWFGDLVTMRWWNDLWLNESFATYMSYKAMESVYPEWEMDKQYILDTIGTALAADQLKSTHPISVNVNEPAEVDQIFDEISYEKGGSVLSMVEDYVGRDVFREGLHYYLDKHKYSNASKEDLWNAIDYAAKRRGKQLSLSRVVGYWIDNPGYPVIDVDYDGKGNAAIAQHRFTLLWPNTSKQAWPIPMHYRLNGKESGFRLFDRKKMSIPLNGSDYIKLNYMQKGIYRVKYPEQMLNKLGLMVRSGQLSPVDAWGVENDLYTLARASRIRVEKYLEFVQRYCMDAGYPLNFSVSGHLGTLSVYLRDNKRLYAMLNRITIQYHRRILNRLGWRKTATERSTTTMLRALTIKSLGIAGDRETVERIGALFAKRVSDGPTAIEPDIKGAVYGTIAFRGNLKTFDTMVGLYNGEKLPEEKVRLLSSLGAFSDPMLIRKALAFSMSKSVRLQDSFSIPAGVASNPVGKSMIWAFTKSNWRGFMGKYEPATHMLGRFMDNLFSIDDARTREEIRRFFSNRANMRPDVKRPFAQVLEFTDINVRFLEHNSD